MADGTWDPIANQLGATPEDSSAIVNFASILFTAPGGHLGTGALVVINGTGNTGSPISLQYVIGTTSAPSPVLDGSVKSNVIDPTASGIFGSQIDFSDVIVPAGGGILALQVVVPADVVIGTTLIVSLSIGVFWDPATFSTPP